MRVLVTGASGFVGSLLVPRLRAEGHRVRVLGRDERRLRAALARELSSPAARDERDARGKRSGRDERGGRDERRRAHRLELARGDVLTGAGLERALAGVEVAYYLVHSMERIERSAAPHARFPERERIAAETFAAAAAAAGVRRIVYLGGLVPSGEHARSSPHLASRELVERLLLAAVPDSLALRASIVIGARSRSFRLLVHLLERMPVLTLPAWRSLRTQPIDERDVIAMLAACAGARLPRRSLDVGGPDVMSYAQMLRGIADVMLVNRPAVRLGVNLTGFTARVAAAVAGEDPELVVALMEGLTADLLPARHHAAELLGVRLHSFRAAVEHALAEWELAEPLAAR
ncbi:MAG TPA: NAD-dependent epimerase/dehydratase family protein [Solirubrobacteraceae bacterium]|nr:NAD-dependent epimerase/dehydratase family protein [Solirubrobacteraceae bacterium]